MSISSEITQLESNLSASYTACQNKGATIPTDKNFDNLATCIGTISGGGSSPVITSLNVTPTTSAQTITAPSGTDGYSPVNVSAVTSAIDQNITQSNIKSGVTILGITGNYTGTTPTLITKNITQNGTYNASSDNADGYSSVTVNVSGGGSDPIGILFQGDVDANGNYIMPYNLTWTGDIYFNGIKNISNYSSTSGGAFASYLYHQASQANRLKCRKIIGKVYFPDLETINHTSCFYSFCNGQTEVTEVHFPKLYRTQGSSAWDYAFQGMGSNKLHLYFNAFNSTYASSNVSNMGTRMLSGTTGATLHFPSNLSGTITSNFGGTNTVRLFDLPATS